ncbi:MAG: 3-dehydroquinate synthase [Bacteroidota bacterium]|nr:3-dehydroquinate synthase [Bacteroidota bacterium]
MKSIRQSFTVTFEYDVHFTEGLFSEENNILKEVIEKDGATGRRKFLILIDDGVHLNHPQLKKNIKSYFKKNKNFIDLRGEPIIIQGGEQAKNQPQLVEDLLIAINARGICRHSYLMAIGGGALLDLAGYVASIAHRGIRHIRIPTTVLSQNDSGIGVKNGINAFNKKNFLGAFDPPFSVINDFEFLKTLEDRDWRSGISEAIKVALIKDKAFFKFIQKNADLLNDRDMEVMKELIYHCADMHLKHIAGKDPFETGSSRPLDFGHWGAHKLEQLTSFELRHGEAVAIGIALDSTYSHFSGRLSKQELDEIIDLIIKLGFELFVPELLHKKLEDDQYEILNGLNEFREHLGGRLTIMLLNSIGEGIEVHEMDHDLIIKSINYLEEKEKLKLTY